LQRLPVPSRKTAHFRAYFVRGGQEAVGVVSITSDIG
jgi:hypothetical protein